MVLTVEGRVVVTGVGRNLDSIEGVAVEGVDGHPKADRHLVALGPSTERGRVINVFDLKAVVDYNNPVSFRGWCTPYNPEHPLYKTLKGVLAKEGFDI